MNNSVSMPRVSKVVVFLAVLAFSLWSPFVFGSNRPFLWAINGLALSGLVLFLLPFVPRAFVASDLGRFGGLAFVALVLWIMGSIGMAFVFGPSDVMPAQSVPTSFRALEPLASFSPSDSFLILIALISHALLWWTCVQLARDQWAALVLWCIFGVVCAYAVVAIANAYFDPIFVLPTQLARGSDAGSTELAFINRNHFTTYLGIGAIVALSLAMDAARGLSVFGERATAVPRLAIAVFGLTLVVFALLLLQSRMGLIATSVGLFIVIVVHGVRHRAWVTLCVFLGLYAFGVIVATYVALDVLERFVRSELDFGVRFEIYRQAIELWLLRPWTGFGAGSFETAFSAVKDTRLYTDRMWTRAHNSYLTVLVELGIIGSLFLSAVFIWLLIEQVKALLNHHSLMGLVGVGALTVVGLHATLDFSLEIYAVMSLLTMVLALSTGINQRDSSADIAPLTPLRMNPSGLGPVAGKAVRFTPSAASSAPRKDLNP